MYLNLVGGAPILYSLHSLHHFPFTAIPCLTGGGHRFLKESHIWKRTEVVQIQVYCKFRVSYLGVEVNAGIDLSEFDSSLVALNTAMLLFVCWIYSSKGSFVAA